MTPNEYQQRAHTTAKYPGSDTPALNCVDLAYPLFGLTSEVGEIADKLKKNIRDRNGEITYDDLKALMKELGDVQWYLAEICTRLGLSLEDVMCGNVVKLADRYARNVISGSGDER